MRQSFQPRVPIVQHFDGRHITQQKSLEKPGKSIEPSTRVANEGPLTALFDTPDIAFKVMAFLRPRDHVRVSMANRQAYSVLHSHREAAKLAIKEVPTVTTSEAANALLDSIDKLPASFRGEPLKALGIHIFGWSLSQPERWTAHKESLLRKFVSAAEQCPKPWPASLEQIVKAARNGGPTETRDRSIYYISAEVNVTNGKAQVAEVIDRYNIWHPHDIAELNAEHERILRNGGPKIGAIKLNSAILMIKAGQDLNKVILDFKVVNSEDIEELTKVADHVREIGGPGIDLRELLKADVLVMNGASVAEVIEKLNLSGRLNRDQMEQLQKTEHKATGQLNYNRAGVGAPDEVNCIVS
jgi:hypothetical protein